MCAERKIILLSLRYEHKLVPFEPRIVLSEKKCEGVDAGDETQM